MWFYANVSRDEFEIRKDYVEQIMCEFGAAAAVAELLYEPKTTSCLGDFAEIYYSKRPFFERNGEYFRVDELLCGEKPFIVIECGTFEDLLNNTMEDANPFPYDLPDDEIKREVKYLFGIEPYPC